MLVSVAVDRARGANELALEARDARGAEHVLVEEDQRKVAADAPAELDDGRAPVAQLDLTHRAQHHHLLADMLLQPPQGIPVGQGDVVVLALGLALELLDELGPRVPPLQPFLVVAVVVQLRVPDADALLLRLTLGGDELVVEAARVGVLGEVGAHAGAHRLDVVVDPAALLPGEDVDQVAVVAAADVLGVVALQPHRAHPVEKLLGEAGGLLAQWGGALDRLGPIAALGLEVLIEALLVEPAVLLGLEGLLGVDGQQAQAGVQPGHLDGVAVDHRVGGQRELAQHQPRGLQRPQPLLDLGLAQPLDPLGAAAAAGQQADRDQQPGQQWDAGPDRPAQSQGGLAAPGVPGSPT